MQTGNAYVFVYTTVRVKFVHIKLLQVVRLVQTGRPLAIFASWITDWVHVCEQHVVSCKMCIRVL